MAVIDPTTNLGRVRLRVGDFTDFQIFPDSVYESTLIDCANNVPQASKLMAQYILATLSMRVHERLGNVEVFGSDYAKQYVAFIKTTILNPNMMEIAPIPYGSGIAVEQKLLKFREDFNNNYSAGTQDQLMSLTAYTGLLNYYF